MFGYMYTHVIYVEMCVQIYACMLYVYRCDCTCTCVFCTVVVIYIICRWTRLCGSVIHVIHVLRHYNPTL